MPIAGYPHRYAREVERKLVGLYTLPHTVKTSETSVKTFFTKILKDVHFSENVFTLVYIHVLMAMWL